jgi:hypothetical protein
VCDVNGRDDLLRAHVYRAYALRDTEDIHQAVLDVIDGWMLYPAIEAQLALGRVRVLAVAPTDEERWYESIEASRSRPRGPHPGAGDLEAWISDGVELMRSTYLREEAAVAA